MQREAGVSVTLEKRRRVLGEEMKKAKHSLAKQTKLEN